MRRRCSGAGYQPRGEMRDYFLGAWKLVSTEKRYPDGRTMPFPDLGADAVGFLIYTPSGHMCAQLMKPGRRHWIVDGTPTPSEATSALDGFFSYCGTFELREQEQTIIHLPETAVAQLGEDYTSATISSRQSRSVLFSGYRTGEAKRRACSPSSLDDYVGTAEIARACCKNAFFSFP